MGTRKGARLLERARLSPNGWKRREIDKLYKSFGFEIRAGKEHDIAVHPGYPHLRGTLTRSSGEIHPDYVRHAVDMIDKLQELKGG